MDRTQSDDTEAGSASEEDTLAAYEAFAQSSYYLDVWQPQLKGADAERTFNWAAMIFGMTWCFYRKMYGVGLLMLPAAFLAALGAALIAMLVIPGFDPRQRSGIIAVTIVAMAAIRIPLAMLANQLYYRKATKQIEQLAAPGLRNGPWLEHLRTRGGTSIVGVVLAVAINLLVGSL